MIHYKNSKGYDVIDIVKDYNLNFNIGNVLKYCVRAGVKDKDKHVLDLQKAITYLEREIEYLKQKSN